MAELTNAEIAAALDRYGKLLELAGENPFRAHAYVRAAAAVRDASEPVAMMVRQGRLESLSGVGSGLAAAIAELVETGRFQPLVELESTVPGGLVELLSLPGVGLKTAMRLYRQLGVSDTSSLEAALADGRIEQAKGLGKRTATAIRSGLEAAKLRTGRLRLGTVRPVALELVAALRQALRDASVSLAGSVRRMDETVADIDIVVATPSADEVIHRLERLPHVATSLAQSPVLTRLRLQNGIEADVIMTSPEQFGTVLIRSTGSAGHLRLLGELPTAATEAEVYARLGLPWIPPELRLGAEELNRRDEIPGLVVITDTAGEFHCHTTWSDGNSSIAEMAAAAEGRGYRFLAISDHSHGLGIAGGLSPARLAAQRREIDEVNATSAIRLLAGAEVEVHRDGRLDYDDETLAQLDVVIASLHSGLRQPRDRLTERLLRVLANPHVDIIAHPSGRLIEQREGGDFDWDHVFTAAASSGTALEINADPARLDLSAPLAERALEAGCLLTINCDAHSPSGFSLIEYGLAVARRAWAKPDQILNCWPTDQIDSWLTTRSRPPASHARKATTQP